MSYILFTWLYLTALSLTRGSFAFPLGNFRRQDTVTFAVEYPFSLQKLRFTGAGTFQISVFNDLHYGEGTDRRDRFGGYDVGIAVANAS